MLTALEEDDEEEEEDEEDATRPRDLQNPGLFTQWLGDAEVWCRRLPSGEVSGNRRRN